MGEWVCGCLRCFLDYNTLFMLHWVELSITYLWLRSSIWVATSVSKLHSWAEEICIMWKVFTSCICFFTCLPSFIPIPTTSLLYPWDQSVLNEVVNINARSEVKGKNVHNCFQTALFHHFQTGTGKCNLWNDVLDSLYPIQYIYDSHFTAYSSFGVGLNIV